MQQHLSRVYASLALTVAAATVGAYLHLVTHIGGMLTGILALGAMLYLAMDSDKTNYTRRLAVLGSFGLLKGMSIGGLVEMLLMVNPALLVQAFLGTLVIFGSFSLGAMLSRRRSLLYMGATLGSALSLLALFSFANFFLRSDALLSLQLYGGLIVFVGYVAFDTQLIIERAAHSDADFVWHALELFIDFVAIFVRIAIILLRKERNEREKKSRS